jgi:hypothetical protein
VGAVGDPPDDHSGDFNGRTGQYEQLFWTVNIALAAAWCELEQPPVDKISIPEAVLETKTFRFATMQLPAWSAAIVVVGADGCLIEETEQKTERVILYANEGFRSQQYQRVCESCDALDYLLPGQ